MRNRNGYFFIKRIFDILSSGAALVVLSPIWLIAIIGILVSDPGPIFYMADRVGKGSRHFKMFKFRSMRVDNKANEKSFKADTNRIFKFGAIMRATKLDELPQLLNVLLGDMSVVGPRPASADQVEITRGGANACVADVKPGLTSTSAIYDYIYGDSIEDEREYELKVLPNRLRLDIYYVHHMSVLYDIRLIFDTVICIVATILKLDMSKKRMQLTKLADDYRAC